MYCHAHAALIALVVAVGACQQGQGEVPLLSRDAPTVAPVAPATSAERAPPTRWFHATLTTSSGEVPFFLGFDGAPGAEKAIVANGGERIEGEVVRDGDKVSVRFPVFDTSLELAADPRGLVGTRKTPYVKEAQAVLAVPVAGPDPLLRFPADPASAGKPTANFSGAWRVDFAGRGRAKGVFEQDAQGGISGTFVIKKFGDVRYLAGRVDGDRMRVSTFDGQHAYTFVATAGPKPDQMSGRWIDGDGLWNDRFEAVRDEESTIDLFDEARLKRSHGKLTLAALEEPRFKGKPVIVDLFGTWCPGCMDATPFLIDLYRENHARGLEILGLAYQFETPEQNRADVARFVARYGVPWEVKVLDVEFDDGFAEALPPELKGVEAWPTAVFLDADHEVLAIHVGFVGTAAGAEHARMAAAWRAVIARMLAPPAASAP
jgi:thiol-disulfide isomerase/thioredoxin